MSSHCQIHFSDIANPRHFLTLGATLAQGLLSFTGVLAIMSCSPITWGAFALTVLYEGEIYHQNIKDGWEKLFIEHYLNNYLNQQLTLRLALAIKENSTLNNDRKKKITQELENIDKLPSEIDLTRLTNNTENQLTIPTVLEKLNTLLVTNSNDEQKVIQSILLDLSKEFQQKKWQFYYAGIFSLLAGISFVPVTNHLLVLALISLHVTLPPSIILTFAVTAGIGYSFLVYNALTNMINDGFFKHFINELSDKNNTWLKKFVAISVILLAPILTFLTAGTAWTVLKHIIPSILQIVSCIVIGIANGGFFLENSKETYDDLVNIKLANISTTFKEKLATINAFVFNHMSDGIQRNIIQRLNIFALLRFIIVSPLRTLLFVGHLISIGVTADRCPRLPSLVGAVITTSTEALQDAHYFVPHEREHYHSQNLENQSNPVEEYIHRKEYRLAEQSHDHDDDIPAKLIKYLVDYPLSCLAVTWDVLFSLGNSNTKDYLTFTEASKRWGLMKESSHRHHDAEADVYSGYGVYAH